MKEKEVLHSSVTTPATTTLHSIQHLSCEIFRNIRNIADRITMR